MNKVFLFIVLFCLLGQPFSCFAQKVGKNDYFYVLNTRQGLSDNCILQMMQLADGQLAVRTRKGVNLYDGRRFVLIPLPSEKEESIAAYKGQTHLYADNRNRLWVKDYQKIFCVQLTERRLLEHPLDSLLHETGQIRNGLKGRDIQDLFVESRSGY